MFVGVWWKASEWISLQAVKKTLGPLCLIGHRMLTGASNRSMTCDDPAHRVGKQVAMKKQLHLRRTKQNRSCSSHIYRCKSCRSEYLSGLSRVLRGLLVKRYSLLSIIYVPHFKITLKWQPAEIQNHFISFTTESAEISEAYKTTFKNVIWAYLMSTTQRKIVHLVQCGFIGYDDGDLKHKKYKGKTWTLPFKWLLMSFSNVDGERWWWNLK